MMLHAHIDTAYRVRGGSAQRWREHGDNAHNGTAHGTIKQFRWRVAQGVGHLVGRHALTARMQRPCIYRASTVQKS